MSFDPTLPTDRDTSRFWLGDWATVELLTDAQYDAVLSLYGLDNGTAFLADGLAVKYAQRPDRVALPSGLSVSWASRVSTWLSLAERLRNGQGIVGGAFARTMTRNDGYAQEAAEELL